MKNHNRIQTGLSSLAGNLRRFCLVATVLFTLSGKIAWSQSLGASNSKESNTPAITFDPKYTSHEFVSGTNCTVSVFFKAKQGNLSYVQLTIGDTIVKSFAPLTSESRIIVTYDSSHFSDNETIPVTAFAANDKGGTNTVNLSEQMKSPVAYNKAYATAHFGLTYRVPALAAVSSGLGEMNHSLSNQEPMGIGTKTQVLNAIPQNTVFYIYTHGGESPNRSPDPRFVEIYWPIPNPDPNGFENVKFDTLTYAEVAQAMQGKNPHIPLYNFVFFDSCSMGVANFPFARAFGLDNTANTKDKAALAFSKNIYQSQENVNFSNIIFQSLKDGKTIKQAIDDANARHDGSHVDYRDPIRQEGPIFEKCTVLVGDWQMKLHGAYGGESNNWYYAY